MDSSRPPRAPWSDDTPPPAFGDRDTRHADATVPVGARSPVAHWAFEQTSSDGTPVLPRADAVGAAPAVFDAHIDAAPPTLPMGTTAPAVRPSPLAATRPSGFESVPPATAAMSAPAVRGLSTALPPRGQSVRWMVAPAAPPATRATPLWLWVAFACIGLCVMLTLVVAVLASER